jgi:hypothetical protein
MICKGRIGQYVILSPLLEACAFVLIGFQLKLMLIE